MFKYTCRNQAFRLVVRDHPVLLSQSMVISTQPGSARPVGSCQKFPWHGTRKNVMCENGPLFQHRYFLHNKFIVNEESLQNVGTSIVVEKIAANCGRMWRRFYIMSEVRLSDFAHNVGQWIILNHAIVLWDNRLYLRARSPYIQSLIARPLLTDSFCREQSMITAHYVKKS